MTSRSAPPVDRASGPWPAAVVVAIGLVAYTDWRVVTNVSVGYLYLIPLVLAASVVRHTGWLWCVVLGTAALRETFGPFEQSGWPLLVRSVLVPSVYAFVGFWVYRHQARRRELTELVDRQRQQLSHDVEDAAALQHLLIPARLPRVSGWDVSARLYPARVVAGDYFDVIWDGPRQELVIVVADVAGKGIAAAMLMPVVQVTVRRLRAEGRPPHELAEAFNDTIIGLTEHPRFVSLVYGVVAVATGELTYVNLGHPPPVLVSSTAGRHQWLTTGGPIAGAVRDARYETGHLTIEPGDRLVLYTDGVTETEDDGGQPFGEDRIVDVVTRRPAMTAGDVVDRLHDAVETHCAHPSARDDLTLIVLGRDTP